MKQRTSNILFSYWNDVRGNRLAPSRFDIEPSRIAEILAETFILECGDNQSYDFRLAGTRICEHFGVELRGHDFLELAGPDERHVVAKAMATIVHQGAVGLFELEALDRSGRSAVFEVLVLPLVHGERAITRFVGSISAIDPPVWLGHEPLTPHTVLSHTMMWPDGRPHAVIAQSRRQAPFVPELANARIVRFNRLQFRILDGGKGPGNGGVAK